MNNLEQELDNLLGKYQIERNVPLPAKGSANAARTIYPFKQMEVEDSFFVELKEGDNLPALQRRLVAAVTSYRRRNGEGKFVVRQVEDGVRVWRTE